MIDYLIELDQQLFFFLNGFHTDWLDTFMYWYTGRKIWIPFYALLAFWIFREYKWKGLLFLAAAGAAVGLSDFVISGMMKPFFERYRPSRDPSFEGMVHIVRGYTGGRYGFASSHAGTSFALATYIYLLFRKNYKWAFWMFAWAAVMSYTRIYMGVHYPGDILVGALIGFLVGYIFYKLSYWIDRKYFSPS